MCRQLKRPFNTTEKKLIIQARISSKIFPAENKNKVLTTLPAPEPAPKPVLILTVFAT